MKYFIPRDTIEFGEVFGVKVPDGTMNVAGNVVKDLAGSRVGIVRG